MENTNLAQWAIDNRYPKNEKEKVSDFEMYHKILQHTAQLKSDKEELLEALEKCNKFLYDFKQQSLDDAYELQSETNSLIQKHKQ